MTETWVSNSAVESGGMGWRGGVVDGIGVVGASGEHIYAGRQTVHTHIHKNNNNRNKYTGGQ